MKILLVDPPGKNKGLNTGLGYLSAILRESHDVYVLDLNNVEIGLCGEPNPEIPEGEIRNIIIRAIDEFNPDLFGVSVKTFTAEISKAIINISKNERPDLPTIVGGPHITLDGSNYIQNNKIDFGIQGEGEYTFDQLCKSLEHNKSFENIAGFYYWKDRHLIHNPLNNTIEDLDSLPFPSFDNFSSVSGNNGVLKEYPILTSRGCPYSCAYCSMPKIMGKKWRSQSSERVIAELQHAKQKYRSTSFTVVDDNFTLNLNRVKSICDLLVTENVDIPWNSQNGIRADRISEDLARNMKQSGCHHVWIGIESADDEVFNKINKGENLEDIKTGIKHLKRSGINVGGFFIVGLPYSTRDTDLKSVDFVKENKIDGWWFNFVPYPHTPAFDWVQNHATILRPSEGVLQFGTNSIDPVFETEEYSRESRINTYNEIHIKLGLFDRLVDPSLNHLEKWHRAFKIVSQYGAWKILLFFVFIIKYNLQLVLKSFKR